MIKGEFEKKAEKVKRAHGYFAVHIPNATIFAEDYEIKNELPRQWLYLYYHNSIIAKMLLENVIKVDYF